jgi:hypothetical protein
VAFAPEEAPVRRVGPFPKTPGLAGAEIGGRYATTALPVVGVLTPERTAEVVRRLIEAPSP